MFGSSLKSVLEYIINTSNDVSKTYERNVTSSLVTVCNTDTFYLRRGSEANSLIYAWNVLFNYLFTKGSISNNSIDIDNVLKIDRILPIASANGMIMIVRSLVHNRLQERVPKFIVKVALNQGADSLSYEFYIGKTLNKLRVLYGMDSYACIYGGFKSYMDRRIPIGGSTNELNDVIRGLTVSELKISEKKGYSKKFHLVYEYINDTKNNWESITLNEYINEMYKTRVPKMEEDLINIIIILMLSLQIAQNEYSFTHYDLHMNNIMLMRLSKERTYTFDVNGTTYNITTDIVPHIIDYGKSYVDPIVVPSEKGMYYDRDTDEVIEFNSFEKFQRVLEYPNVTNRSAGGRYTKGLEAYLHRIAMQVLYGNEFNEINENDTKESLIIKKVIFEKFYDGVCDISSGVFRILEFNFGIQKKFHPAYDFFRLLNILHDTLMHLQKKTGIEYRKIYIWNNIIDRLRREYPFHDGSYYSLPKIYNGVNVVMGSKIDESGSFLMDIKRVFNTPVDIVDSIYSLLEEKNNKQVGSGIENEFNYSANIKNPFDLNKIELSEDELKERIALIEARKRMV